MSFQFRERIKLFMKLFFSLSGNEYSTRKNVKLINVGPDRGGNNLYILTIMKFAKMIEIYWSIRKSVCLFPLLCTWQIYMN